MKHIKKLAIRLTTSLDFKHDHTTKFDNFM
jgi:hypothetical protein